MGAADIVGKGRLVLSKQGKSEGYTHVSSSPSVCSAVQLFGFRWLLGDLALGVPDLFLHIAVTQSSLVREFEQVSLS